MEQRSYPDFELSVRRIDANHTLSHRKEHFEIVYILDGHGKQVVNEEEYDYQPGDLLLLNVGDQHTFTASFPTELCVIDLTGGYFSFLAGSGKSDLRQESLFGLSEYIYHHHFRPKGNVVTREKDKEWVGIQIDRLLKGNEQSDAEREEASRNIVFGLLQVVSGYLSESPGLSCKDLRGELLVKEVLNYIHQHIYDRENSKIENIARRFDKSKDNLSVYFKTQTGITIKDYILSYKFELAKTRLLHSDLVVSTIATQLNFSDESHLNKLFKNKLGITAKGFRKQNKKLC